MDKVFGMDQVDQNTNYIKILTKTTDTEEWIKALTTNDGMTVEDMLQTMDDIEVQHFLHGQLIVSDNLLHITKESLDSNLDLSLSYAVVFCAYEVVEILLCWGVDVLQQDSHGNNSMHCLVLRSFLTDGRVEDKCLEAFKWLLKHLSSLDIRTLMEQENMQGLRPMEYAGHLDSWQLCAAMMEVSVVHQKQMGLSLYKLYDVTDYEGDKARLFNPALMIASMSEKALLQPPALQFFKSNVIKCWSKNKLLVNGIFITTWIFLRIIYLSFHLLYTFKGPLMQNFTNYMTNTSTVLEQKRSVTSAAPTSVQMIIVCYLILYSVIGMIYDAAETLLNIRNWLTYIKTPRGFKRTVLHYEFYRLLVITTYVMVTITYGNEFAKYVAEPFLTLETQVLFFNTIDITIPWTILYFIQLLPKIGHYVIVVQRLVMDVTKFSLIAIFYVFPFFLIVQRLSYTIMIDEFLTFHPMDISKASYFVYSTIMNIIPLDAHDIMDNPIFLYFVYLAFMVVALLLMNFLIALFSDTVAFLNLYSDVIIYVQRMELVFRTEQRLRKLPLFSLLYTRLTRHLFHIDKDRVYLQVVDAL